MINTLRVEKLIRQLAKTHEYQVLFSYSKELHFKLFDNDSDFSSAQMHFLSFLNMYATLSMDIYLNEVDEMVLDNEIYEDAYLYYKQTSRNKKKEEAKNYKLPNNKRSSIEKVSQIKSQWQFRRRKT